MKLFGRSSSHFTRIARIFAHELEVPYEFEQIFDITSTDPAVFGENPALKLPTLRTDDGLVFGTENICRTLAEHSSRAVIWPEHLRGRVSRNAQELVWHGMSAQVQLVFGTTVGKLSADDVYFVKARAGLEGSLRWLEANVDEALAALPPERTLSLFEVALFCFVTHLDFRTTVSTEPYARLRKFCATFDTRASAKATPYEFPKPRQ
jgi:glutathione S-transferase